MTRALIQVRTSFEGYHCWPEAPEEVAFLRSEHRHVFGITAKISVFNYERELEFIMVQHRIEEFLHSVNFPKSASCESMAYAIASHLKELYGFHRYVEVLVDEDGENGSIIILTENER